MGKSWPEWLPAFIASTRKKVYLAFDADEPDAQGIRAGDDASEKLAAALRYYDCRSERLRPVRAKDWNGQLLEVSECRRLCTLLFKQVEFLNSEIAHPCLSRRTLLERSVATLDALSAACVAAGGPDTLGYEDGPLDPSANRVLPMWHDELNRLAAEAGEL